MGSVKEALIMVPKFIFGWTRQMQLKRGNVKKKKKMKISKGLKIH